jgi:UDP-glucose 4-epimerase
MHDELKGKTILVTGGAGFIGSHLVDRLIEVGAGKVVVLDSLLTGRVENLEQHRGNPALVFSHGDANDRSILTTIFQEHRPHYVFHLAALVGVKRVEEQPLDVIKDIDGIRAIFELSKTFGVKKVLYSSSSEVYGEPVELPTKEGGPVNPNPRDPYALVKMLGENFCHFYNHKYGLPTVATRFFNVYGPRQDASGYGFVVGIFLNQALKGEPLNIFGDGSATRDFVFYKDNIECLLKAITTPECDGETINIGKGEPTTIKELAEKIAALSGKDLELAYLPPRKLEIKYRNPDITKMKSLLGCSATTTLEDGLKFTFEELKKKHGGA